MGEPEDGMLQAADAIVDAAWPEARRMAARRLRVGSLVRWSGAMAAVSAMAVAPHLAAGTPVPWEGLAVIGFLAAMAAHTDPHERAHLDPPAAHGG